MSLVGGVDLPAPVALAKLVDTVTPPGIRNAGPKWDSYRALSGGGRLYWRRGTDLGKLFSDLLPVPGCPDPGRRRARRRVGHLEHRDRPPRLQAARRRHG